MTEISSATHSFLFVDEENAPLRVLLLEDLSTDAELIKLQLRKLQVEKEIEHVKDKDEYLHALATFKPHIILSDYTLPQYTGMEALQDLKSINSYVPFIICTGSLNEETAVACMKAGADDYVLKDSMGRLPSAIENALENKKTLVLKERASYELKKSEEDFKALAESAPEQIYKLNSNGVILYANRKLSNVSREQLKGRKIYDFIIEKNHDRLKTSIETCFETAQKQKIEIEGEEDDPESKWYMCSIGPVLKDGKVDAVVFIPANITQRKRAELDLRDLNERLHNLTQHLETVRDEEKKKIAMEIHDQLGQELTGTKLGLYWMQQHLKQKGLEEADYDQLQEKIEYLINLSTQTISTVRRIAHELRPVVLDDIGLIPALEWHVENYKKSHEINCHLRIDTGDMTFGKDFSTAIYRVTQEALTNIARHAKAENAYIKFYKTADKLHLEIEDDGQGMDLEKARKSKSMGLFGIRERIKKWDGDIHIESGHEDGTQIHISFEIENLK
ncbi:sensor histidine kinase [Halocola ammonii]